MSCAVPYLQAAALGIAAWSVLNVYQAKFAWSWLGDVASWMSKGPAMRRALFFLPALPFRLFTCRLCLSCHLCSWPIVIHGSAEDWGWFTISTAAGVALSVQMFLEETFPGRSD